MKQAENDLPLEEPKPVKRTKPAMKKAEVPLDPEEEEKKRIRKEQANHVFDN